MLAPKRVQWRKVMKSDMRGHAQTGNDVSYGDFGLMAIECGYLTSRQIEAARISMTRKVKRGAKVWIRIFPQKPVTKKPAETRMGHGKGPVEYYVARIKPGVVLFEIGGIPAKIAKEAFRLADTKLPFKCRFIAREGAVV